jgi:pRiA4b ORF-3-like protein
MPGRDWLAIEVVLVSGRALVLDPQPGRIVIASPTHTLADLAATVDAAFARWDLSHLHLFRVDGAGTFMPDGDPDMNAGNSQTTTLGWLGLTVDQAFEYVFDLGDDWLHRCVVASTDVDPREEYGERPRKPVVVWGWGWIPDQYGRVTADG